MNGATLDTRIASLAAMSPAKLRVEWQRAWRSAPPEMTPDLLARGIAWKLQARLHGGLPTETRRALRRMETSGSAVDTRPRAGTRIIREWNGRNIHVLVTDTGFVFEDRTYGSLSEIARHITGTNWSGPRFFGIGRKKP